MAVEFSLPQVAAKLGKERTSILRVAKRVGAGRQVGRAWIFTSADVSAIRSGFRKKSGNPNFVAGNHFGKPPQK